jgi:hypothetical protein
LSFNGDGGVGNSAIGCCLSEKEGDGGEMINQMLSHLLDADEDTGSKRQDYRQQNSEDVR